MTARNDMLVEKRLFEKRPFENDMLFEKRLFEKRLFENDMLFEKRHAVWKLQA